MMVSDTGEKEALVKDENEAIEVIKSNMPTSGHYMLREALEIAINALHDVRGYNKIGTVEEVREAVEIQTPKKPDYEGDGYADGRLVYDTWYCPNCGQWYELDYDDYKHCPECGQKIDWSDEE